MADITLLHVGHRPGIPERRRRPDESDAVAAAKVHRALDAGLSPILCVGEVPRAA